MLAGTCCIAAGVALDIALAGGKERVWCFLGDGAEEEGHFYEAALFAAGHNLPVIFIIEDNDRSVDTPRAERRPEGAGGLERVFPSHVKRYHYTPTYPHAGSGCAHKITFKPEAIERMKANQ
jgi:pyruvate dehydrogenase E1 component alpha subunit